ncbi:hypothetical protein TRIP_E300006 [uncultured Spirochaetota bacterium]|nr:hypothetical protein TRIP_E300006 [uncultured Spirochaetota bacterium]
MHAVGNSDQVQPLRRIRDGLRRGRAGAATGSRTAQRHGHGLLPRIPGKFKARRGAALCHQRPASGGVRHRAQRKGQNHGKHVGRRKNSGQLPLRHRLQLRRRRPGDDSPGWSGAAADGHRPHARRAGKNTYGEWPNFTGSDKLKPKVNGAPSVSTVYSVPLFVQTRYTEQGERIWQSSNDGRRSASLR